MRLYGVGESDLREVVRQVSGRLYGGNLTLKECETIGRRRTHVRFTLTVTDSAGPGGRRSRGRRVKAACWHAHRDVMAALFDLAPGARLVSAMADYRGADDFEAKYNATGRRNIGSMVAEVGYRYACECV